MANYIQIIRQAIALFPLILILICIPYFVIEYKRNKTINLKKSLLTFSFILYLVCCYCLVILPLPSYEEVLNSTGPYIDLRFFGWIRDYFALSGVSPNPLTWIPSFRTVWFYIPFFNLIMLIPFGIYMRRLYSKSFIKTLGWAFLLSLSFELIQLSGLFGFYPHPYRLFQLDDLILNTTGAGIGYVLAPKVLEVSEKQKIDFTYRTPLKARILIYVLDLIGISLTMRLIAICLGRPTTLGILSEDLFLYALAAILYAIILTYFLGMRTPASMLFEQGYQTRRLYKPSILGFIFRQVFVFLILTPIPAIANYFIQSFKPESLGIIIGIFLFLIPLIVVVQIILGDSVFFETMTNTYLTDQIKVNRYRQALSQQSGRFHPSQVHVRPKTSPEKARFQERE